MVRCRGIHEFLSGVVCVVPCILGLFLGDATTCPIVTRWWDNLHEAVVACACVMSVGGVD